MNKEKFEKKVQELYAYEDEMLAKMNEIIKPYNEELNKQGYEIVCRLYWENEITERQNDGFELERPDIVEYREYLCVMGLQFQLKGESDGNEEDAGFEIYNNVSFYGVSLFRGWHFHKECMKWIFESVGKCYNLIKEKGLEQAYDDVIKICGARKI